MGGWWNEWGGLARERVEPGKHPGSHRVSGSRAVGLLTGMSYGWGPRPDLLEERERGRISVGACSGRDGRVEGESGRMRRGA